MTDPAPDPNRAKVSLREQAEEAARELTMRYRVYAKRVQSGQMTATEQAAGLSRMRAIRDTLRLFAEHEDAIRAALAAAISKQRMSDELAEVESHPAVAAVLSEFPGARVTDLQPIEEPAEP